MKKFLLSMVLTACILGFNSAFADCTFNVNDRQIVYNTDTLKFYENSILMSESEVQKIFPEYEVLLISQFDKNKKYSMKNSIFKSKKILLLNDTNRTFHGFYVYPYSSRVQFQNCKDEIKSLITIYGKKNTRLKHPGGDEFEIVVK